MTHTLNAAFAPAVHIRYDGRSQRLNVAQLGLPANATDNDVKHAVARHLEISTGHLSFHVIERHSNGNITVRPEAVFG